MSRIKGKDTKPEILVRRYLFAHGLRYRIHDGRLPGKPDLVFSKIKKAVFVHGCYWHGHENCHYFVPPKTRTSWWLQKIDGNRARDNKNIKELKELGWEPIIIWECQLKKEKREKTLRALSAKLKGRR